MPKSRALSVVIVYKGNPFRRYPDSERWADRMYYVPHAHLRQQGIGRLHQEIWKDAYGPIPEGYHIHHKDGNPLNNTLDNLECLPKQKHHEHHGEQLTDEQREWRRSHVNDIRDLASEWHKSEEGRAWHRLHGKQAWIDAPFNSYTCDYCETVFQSRDHDVEHVRFCSNRCRSAARRHSGVDDIQVVCAYCEETYMRNKYSQGRFCSPLCARHSRTK